MASLLPDSRSCWGRLGWRSTYGQHRPLLQTITTLTTHHGVREADRPGEGGGGIRRQEIAQYCYETMVSTTEPTEAVLLLDTRRAWL